jgi:hypothetical protein
MEEDDMTSRNSTAAVPPNENLELALDELEAASGGGKTGGNTTPGHIYLVFNFKLVAVKTIS